MANPFPFKTTSHKMIGEMGVDRTASIGSAQAEELNHGLYPFAMRNCAGVSDEAFISDLQNCLHAGLTCGIYQGFYPSMWTEGTSAGTHRGNEAVHKAKRIGYPKRGTVYLNVEGAGTIDHGQNGLPAQDVIDWINAWAKVVKDAGYEAGIYVGQYETEQPLDGSQLYYDLIVTHYWLNCSSSGRHAVTNGQKRGYQIVQKHCNTSYKSISPIDIDSFQNDHLDGYTLGIQKA